MSLLRINFIIVLMLFFLGLIQAVLWSFVFQWLGLLLIADLILVRLKVLKQRKTDKAEEEIAKNQEFDSIILNDDFDIACKKTMEVIHNFIKF